MSEEHRRENEEPQDEVEAHRHPKLGANDEGTQEGEDDFEAHRHPKLGANDEGTTEGEDDFEAHRHSLKARPGRTA